MATSADDGWQCLSSSSILALQNDEGHESATSDLSIANATIGQIDISSIPSPVSAQDAITRLLQFLAGASNEVLCAIAVGLAAITYLILGRLGLMLIGALGGIVLQATWENQSAHLGTEDSHRKEKGLAILARVLDWREIQRSKSQDIEENEQIDEAQLSERGFGDFRPATAAALDELVEATMRDYVDYWYSPILPGEGSFPQACQQTLVSFLRSISRALSKKRPADAFLDILTNTSSIVIVFLGELSNAIMASQDSELSPDQAVQEYLSSNPDSNLSHIMDEKQQRRKFQLITDDLLLNFIEKSVYSCGPARIFLQQVLGGLVMEMSLKACSKPEWLNGWIVYLLEEGEPDLIQAIDAGMEIPSRDESNATVEQPPGTQSNGLKQTSHRKRLSRAEEAMQAAMEEAKRLSQLIAEDDSKRAEESSSAPLEPPSLLPRPEAYYTTLGETSNTKANGATEPRSKIISPSSNDRDREAKAQFTSFDQIVPQPHIDTKVPITAQPPAPLTLHNANITILDDPSPDSSSRGRPADDYLVQIEPHSSRHPGWMIVRKYADFETLHEVLKRIAQVSGVLAFTQRHGTLPTWKNKTKSSLRGDLEDYLRDACRYQPLADSVGLKRFLEKENQGPSGKSFQGIGWPSPAAFETMGKGLVDNLMSASKGATEGGKSVFGGMTGVLGSIGSGSRNRSGSKSSFSARAGSRSSASFAREPESRSSADSAQQESNRARDESLSSESKRMLHKSTVEHNHSKTATSPVESMDKITGEIISISPTSDRRSDTASEDDHAERSAHPPLNLDNIILPPPPSDMADDYRMLGATSSTTQSRNESAQPRASISTTSTLRSPEKSTISLVSAELGMVSKKPRKVSTPFTEEETRVVLELMFAMINELYTLSSAWNIRRTLLTAAKTFLLRPGNPSLASIQSLIQESVISSNISDEGLAAHLRKLRENTMPTEEELKAWPKEPSPEEKEKLRLRARKLVMERGIPPALSGVMGQAATAEAVGRVFDCLQDETVARGLMFGLLLQCIRIITN